MKALKLTAARWSIVALVTLLAAVVTFGASHQKISRKITNAKTTNVSPVVSVHNLGNPQISFAVPSDPQVLAKEREIYAPSEAFRKQAQEQYAFSDLAGAEASCFQALNAAPVIQGQKQPPPFVDLLLGQIYLRGGQYAKAISWLQGAKSHTVTSGLDLDLALAYVRLGDYNNASRLYSDQSVLQDLPGTDSPSALEASILLARGLDVYFEHRHDEALVDFQAAHRLAPDNAVIACYCAYILSEEGRHSEATLLFQHAAATGRGALASEAKGRAANEMPRKTLTWAPLQARRPTVGASKQ